MRKILTARGYHQPLAQRARALIAIASPDAREKLTRAAQELNYILAT